MDRSTRTPAIEVQHLRKTFGATVAVEDVSLTVERGEIFGVLGPNGAGKTTTVECITGLQVPDAGQVRVLGLDPRRDAVEVKERVGVQLQESRLPERLRVGEAVDLYAAFYRDPVDPAELLEQLGLADKRRASYDSLSGGQKQRLSIALALVGRPEVAILDELTTGLDPQARRDTWELVEAVRERGVTVLLVTHFMEEAERLCDRIAVIDRGRVAVVDTPTGLVRRANDEQRLRFRPDRAVDLDALRRLDGVSGVTREGSRLEVTGSGNLLFVVTSYLAREGVVAEDLRVEQRTLDDAFVALTKHTHDEEARA